MGAFIGSRAKKTDPPCMTAHRRGCDHQTGRVRRGEGREEHRVLLRIELLMVREGGGFQTLSQVSQRLGMDD